MNRAQVRLSRSAELHALVQHFARGESAHAFGDLALQIAEFQREYSPGFARLCARVGAPLSRIEAIPGVPCDAFRLSRVAVHPEGEDAARFATSGTTGAGHGIHAFRALETYRVVALAAGRAALLSGTDPVHVVALAPELGDPPRSSLGYMMALFMSEFDARADSDPRAPERWLIDEQGVKWHALEQASENARAAGASLLLLATSFALVTLLDGRDGRELTLPPRSVVMQTGGFKGKTREISAPELRASIASCFGISESHVVGEYGMTELTSQLYEATLPGSALAATHSGGHGTYVEPPWLHVLPVDPVSLSPVDPGDVGIARIIDLGNVDSAIAIQTQDRVRRTGGGIELLGRAPGAPPRGCSLAVEEYLAARGA